MRQLLTNNFIDQIRRLQLDRHIQQENAMNQKNCSRLRSRVIFVFVFLEVIAAQSTLRAVTSSYVGVIDNAGAAGTTTYSTDGYDLYGTTPAGTTVGGFTLSAFGYGARISSFPTYVSAIVANGANSSAGGYSYATINNPLGGQIEAGFTLRDDSSVAEKDLLNIALGSTVPSSFYVGLIEDTGPFTTGDYPDALRLRGPSGGDSGLIATTGDRSVGVDLYFFRVSNAQPGDTLTISGVETTPNPGNGGIHLVLAGLLFMPANPVPEPSGLTILATGIAALMWLRHRSEKRTGCF